MKFPFSFTVALFVSFLSFKNYFSISNISSEGYTKVASKKSNTNLLPVEVLGEEGTIKSLNFNITNEIKNQTSKIWLLVNNLSYENKGSIKINDENWVPLNHSTTQVNQKELAYGGMVHGGFNTIRLTIPATGIKEGANTIQFRFDTSDGISIGYRVVNINLLDASNTKLLSDSFFEEDNPNTWIAPENSSVSKGKDIWFNENLWNHYTLKNNQGFWYGKTIPSRRTIRAKCADCHTQDGRDLEIFSYSNLSIIERSKFHGLTEQDGKDIAAYIRSLSDGNNIARVGRPWNPPYQPGPILKDKSTLEWTAGAGLDWVLEKDADMFPYLFPNGTSKQAVKDVFDSNKMEDRTLLPLAIQFPDWKHWLPIVHPKDAYSKNEWWNNLESTKNPVKNYEAIRADFVTNYNESNIKSFNVPQKLRYLGVGLDGNSGFRYFFEIGSTDNKHWRSKGGQANANLKEGIDLELAKTSLARLMAVKNFEFMNEFNLQDKAPLLVPDPALDQPGERQWPVKWYSVFEVPAHFTSDNSRHYETQQDKTGHYETTTWYNLQFVLNGGNGFVGGTTPTDFNYHTPFMGFAAHYSGINEPLRYFSAINHMYQIRTWSGNNGPGNTGFRIRNQGIWEMMGTSNSNQEFWNPSYDIVKQLDAIEPGLSDKVLEALLLQFLTEVEKYDVNTWPRTMHGGNFELDSASKTTEDLINIPHFGNPNQGRVNERYADKFYDIIPRIQNNFNVSCSITNRIINWCKEAWPLIDFEKYLEDNCSDSNCTSADIKSGNTYRIITTHDKCLNAVEANGYNITQQVCNNSDVAKWVIEDATNGYYYIKNVASQKYISATGDNNGNHVEEANFTGNDNQQWQIIENSNCKFNITAKTSGKCLDLKSGSSADGTHFQLWSCVTTNGENREFTFELLTEGTLGTDDVLLASIFVFPNPVKDVIYINTSDLISSEDIGLSIYDMSGRLILNKKSVESVTELNVSALTTGVYFLHLFNDEKVLKKMFIKE